MVKSKAGLPEGFELSVSEPAALGDFLDEDYAGNAVRVMAAKRAAKTASSPHIEAPPVPERSVVRSQPPTIVRPIAAKEPPAVQLEPERRKPPASGTNRRPERVQLNLRPETEMMLDEVLEYVQRYSLQSDAKMSEIFDAIIGILHDARKEMAFHDVPRRGQWGTPTARAFPTAIGGAFARAIAARYRKLEEGSP